MLNDRIPKQVFFGQLADGYQVDHEALQRQPQGEPQEVWLSAKGFV